MLNRFQLSTGIYNFKVYRATTMLRGSLVSIVYKKTLRIRLADAKESAAITHASSDIDRISISLESAHEIWASSVESIIAIVLLERQLGWACIAPVLLALCMLKLFRFHCCANYFQLQPLQIHGSASISQDDSASGVLRSKNVSP